MIAIVVNLQAVSGGNLIGFSGNAVHGFWMSHWQQLNPTFFECIHSPKQSQPFSLSPIMNLPHPEQGIIRVEKGKDVWFRVNALSEELESHLINEWLTQLPNEIKIAGLSWRVTKIITCNKDNEWAGGFNSQALAENLLLQKDPPSSWKFEFHTPTTFHSESGQLPIPLPGLLVSSWLRRWQEFGPILLPENLPERVRSGCVVRAYDLRSIPARDSRRLVIGCVGTLEIEAIKLIPGERAALDLLAAYSFWSGSGQYTTQGFGMTQLVKCSQKAENGRPLGKGS